MEETVLPNSLTLQVDNGNIPYLAEAAKWGKFLSIFGLIVIFLIIVFGCLAIFAESDSAIFNSEVQDLQISTNMAKAVIGFYIVFVVVISLFPCIYLYNFASKMKVALKSNDQISLNDSFKNLKSCLKFFGVLLVIILCIYAIAFVFAIIAGISLSR